MRNNKSYLKEIALKRINVLFAEANNVFFRDVKLANRYVKLGRKIAMKVNLKIPSNLKKRFCKHCYFYLKPGFNCRVRVRNKMVVYTCFNCKKYMKFGIRKI